MTDRERFEINAKVNGINNFTVNNNTELSWITPNNKLQVINYFDEQGNLIGYETKILS